MVTPAGIDVWTVELDVAPFVVAELARTLTGDERARAGAFHFERDAHRFIVTRAVLRMLLGNYLSVPPPMVAFSYGPRGRPMLAAPFDVSGLTFNVSHSGEIALYAITRGHRVGVDIEQLRPLADLERLAERHFSPAECAALFALPRDLRTQAFFACWTRKEAYVKAVGDGLAHPLKDFTVSVTPGETVTFVEFAHDRAAGQWMLQAIAVPPGYIAAVAADSAVPITVRGVWQAGRVREAQ